MIRGPRWGTTALLLTAATAVLWVVGTLLICGLFGAEAQAVGILLCLIAALANCLMVVRNWIFKLEAATVAGYHAGYHRGIQSRCTPGTTHCDVLDIAEVRARRVLEMH